MKLLNVIFVAFLLVPTVSHAAATTPSHVQVKKFNPTERREDLKLRLTVLREDLAVEYKKPVNLKSITFASVYSPTSDAAVVIFMVGTKEHINVFIFVNGQWTVFPSDFPVSQ